MLSDFDTNLAMPVPNVFVGFKYLIFNILKNDSKVSCFSN